MTTTTQTALQQHPLSAAFPSMPEKEIEALTLDIEAHGQREPGVLLGGMVLDGWHRYLACAKLGVDFKAKEYDGDDPIALVISKNLHRRHMTASQRAMAVVEAHNWRPAGRIVKGEAAAGLSTKQLAEKAEVSERTIEQAKSASAAGLSEPVVKGEVSVERAAAVAKLPEAKREKALKEKKPKAVVASRDVEKLYEAVKTELAEVKEKNSELADVARELNDKLEAFETTELDEQQKLIAELQLTVRKKDAEIDRLRVQIRDANNKANALIREVKNLQRRAGVGQ